jgi:hypothetical protein
VSHTCLYPTYIRGQAYLAAGRGKEAAAEFQKILDHSGMVWNCWTGALARLGVARANGLQAENSTGADADAASVRALAAYKDAGRFTSMRRYQSGCRMLADLRVLIPESTYGLVINGPRPTEQHRVPRFGGLRDAVYASLSSSVRYLGASVLTF